MLQDRFGLPLTIASEAARDAYVEAVDLMLSANAGAEPLLRQAIAEEPGFALAHAALARLCQMQMRGPEAAEAATAAREFATSASERERGHVEAVALLVEGRGADAYAAVRAHAQAQPRDAVPLSLALGVYGLIGFSGRREHHEEQRDLLLGLADAWGEDWWFLTYLGWSHVETGAPGRGIPMLDRGLELHPRNAHGAHARAHGYYEAGEPETGGAFIEGWLPQYDRAGQLHCHLSWHRALFALQQGDVDTAMSLYAGAIDPEVAQSPPLFTLADAASLLWRLGAYGHPVDAGEAQRVAAFAARAFPHAGLAFADVHASLAAAAAGDRVGLDQRTGEVDALLAERRLPAGPAVAAMCRGIAAFGNGHYDIAIDHLEGAMADLPRIGGSHAQRDVIEDSLIVAYLRAERREQAETAMRRRVAERAGHLDANWLARLAG